MTWYVYKKSFSFHSGAKNQEQNRSWVLFQTREKKRGTDILYIAADSGGQGIEVLSVEGFEVTVEEVKTGR